MYTIAGVGRAEVQTVYDGAEGELWGLVKIGFDMDIMQGLGAEMGFVQQLGHEGKIMQGMLVGTKP